MAIVAVWMYVAFYGLAPNFGSLDGRPLDFAAYEQRGWFELALLLAGLVFAVISGKRFIVPLTIAAALFAVVNAVQVLTAIDWGRQPLTSGAATAADLTASNDFVTSAARTLRIPELSSSRNIIVIVLDTFQNDVLESIVRTDSVIANALEGFTIYTNAMGHFPFTQLSIGAVLRGEVYDGRETIPAYLERTNAQKLPAILSGAGYEVDLLPLHSRHAFLAGRVSRCRAYAEVVDLFLFRQVPLLLKRAVYDDGQFVVTRNCPQATPVTEQEQDLEVLSRISQHLVVSREQPTFKWIHLWGMHPPARLDADCSGTESHFDGASVRAQGRCILGKMADILDQLKAEGVYDNSQIFLISDHGSLLGFIENQENSSVPLRVRSSAHPTIAFKDFGATGPLEFDGSPVVLADIYPTILKAVGVSTDKLALNELFEGQHRERFYTFYKSAAEATQERLSRADTFTISGNVRDNAAWSVEPSEIANIPLGRIDLGTDEALVSANYAFSTEAAGAGYSWVLSNPATVDGVLPEADTLAISARVLSPHEGQEIRVSVNGREVALWQISTVNGWETFETTVSLDQRELGAPGVIALDILIIEPINNSTRPLGVLVDWINVEGK
ncbi:hypothetical protein VE25_05005 [Devosia geojensis]|uniref:Sulfatase N-terminal domain-containing protein n=2 Tax=Devosia geojensis TaxID=443610 RepID=A0A0F5FVK4_9HYPH|nr:hypothetical protein VE25_05005 [Devosia geojensis]